jgi:UDP-N-acetylmuramate: L-alanyl-gamma-D-glutamyl-meso-diaminopimelate ligase
VAPATAASTTIPAAIIIVKRLFDIRVLLVIFSSNMDNPKRRVERSATAEGGFLQDLYGGREALYFIPIGGTAMAPLAGMLREAGHRVEGVDSQLYPPMSTLLEDLHIPVRLGFDPELIPTHIDRVIIGNAVPRTNPEVVAILERRLPHLSQAEAVAHYVLARGLHGLVVAGTHGKTTTTAMLAWILEQAGLDPSYLIGGLPQWNPRGFRLGGGPHLVIEGDEYNAAFFDRGPKFLHYRPHIFLLGPVEFDHADLYPDLDAVVTAFRSGTALVPRHGAVVVNTWSPTAVSCCRDATAPVVRVGADSDCALRLRSWAPQPEGSAAELDWRGQSLSLDLPMAGLHNLQNASMAVAAAVTSGVSPESATEAMRTFPGVMRRMEIVGEVAGITVVDDFAHHPTALAVTIAAARQRWPDRRLVIAFEPRSLTAARRSSQNAYLEALSAADVALVAAPYHRDRLEPDEVLDRATLADALKARRVVPVMPEIGEDPVHRLEKIVVPGDVVVGCSSGDFAGFHKRLMDSLDPGGDG